MRICQPILWIPPYIMDKNANAGDIGFYIREDIPSRPMSFKDKDDDNDIEHSFVEMNLRQKKWLFSCSYNSH